MMLVQPLIVLVILASQIGISNQKEATKPYVPRNENERPKDIPVEYLKGQWKFVLNSTSKLRAAFIYPIGGKMEFFINVLNPPAPGKYPKFYFKFDESFIPGYMLSKVSIKTSLSFGCKHAFSDWEIDYLQANNAAVTIAPEGDVFFRDKLKNASKAGCPALSSFKGFDDQHRYAFFELYGESIVNPIEILFEIGKVGFDATSKPNTAEVGNATFGDENKGWIAGVVVAVILIGICGLLGVIFHKKLFNMFKGNKKVKQPKAEITTAQPVDDEKKEEESSKTSNQSKQTEMAKQSIKEPSAKGPDMPQAAPMQPTPPQAAPLQPTPPQAAPLRPTLPNPAAGPARPTAEPPKANENKEKSPPYVDMAGLLPDAPPPPPPPLHEYETLGRMQQQMRQMEQKRK
uniref:Uncharacterized protein n=1 Tax=Panagrolaimus sp. JU765 TaxID=591449 RepID=A0AC34QS87_9BILA